jgi:TP901 family phage tail tape measure protein
VSLITTGINIVATGVSSASAKLKQFGQTVSGVERQAKQFATQYDRSSSQVVQSSSSLKRALNSNWDTMYRSALSGTKNQEKALQRLENAYDRTFREIGNKYQSMVMGSVALSMSGVGIMNFGTATLGATKTALDQARDFETVMSQIQFYGQKTKEEMQGIQKEIFKMGFELPVKTSEIANSVLSAQKLGYMDTTDAQTMAKEASKIQFMSLGKLDGEESMKYISHVRKLTGTAITDTAKLTDKLTMASDVSASSIDSLWKTLQSSRSAFDNLNTDIDTMLTLTGVMSDRLQPRIAGMSLSSFAGGVQMAEKAGMEDRGTRGEYYNQLTGAMGGKFDDYGGDMIKYIQDVADKSKDLWGNGAERTGKLISIFGKSAIDLFHAIDAYNEGTGRSMVDMRNEIAKSDGHAQKLMDTLMNGSYGTEMRLQAMVEQFQILFGTTLRPAFNMILDGITKVIGKVNEFIQAHPKLAKALGYGVGLAGVLAVATGATFMFVGGILAIYASLANVMVQLARNSKVVHLLGQGYATAGQMIKGNFLGPLGTLGKFMLRFSGITFFMAMAWKNDFLRMRTTLMDWYDYTKKGLGKANELFKLYGASSVEEWYTAFGRNKRIGTFDNWITDTALKFMVLKDAIADIWSDGTISSDKYYKLNDMGLLGFVEKIYEIKTAVTDFWKGFEDGVGEGLRLLKDITQPLRKAWNWISEKLLEILQHFGYFENVNKGISSKWEKWGQKLGVMVGTVIAIKVGLWAWFKAIKLVVSPFARIFKLTKSIWGLLSKMKNFKMTGLLKAATYLLPKPLRNKVKGYIDTFSGPGSKRKQRKMQGKHSNIPNARKTPTGQVTYTQPQTWREKRNLKKQKRKQPVINPGRNGANPTRSSKGMGRFKDFWLGRQYAPEERTDKRGRKYHQVRNANGGVTRTDAQGKVKGKAVRTGGGVKGKFGRISKFLGGFINNERGAVGRGAGGVSKKGGGGFFKGILNSAKKLGPKIGSGLMKSMRTIGPKVGKGLIKGLGVVIKRGIPLIFKLGLRAIPILGWALLAWDVIKLVFTNWDAIKSAGSKAWNWLKTTGVSLLGQAWDWIKGKAIGVWEWIKSTGSTAWNWMKTEGVRLLGIAWNWVKTKAIEVWNGTKSKAVEIWNGIKSWAISKATEMWNSVKTKADEIWNGVKTKASETWSSIKTGVATALVNLFQPIKDAWDEAKSYVANNPIVQKITKVTETVKSGASSLWNKTKSLFGGFRTGLWKVPKENYPALLHQGEMVLTQKESQILRSMVGSDSNSISATLLGKSKGGSVEKGISIKGQSEGRKKLSLRPTVKQETVSETSESKGNGDTKIEFKEGSIKISIANASASEIKKGAKQLFEEFKRLVELENMKNYKPSRPRRV